MTSNNETVSRKCHERTTLRKLWRQTGNRPAKCWQAVPRDQRWPDAVAGISARVSQFAFVLFCYITNYRISLFPSTSSRETLRFSGNKIHCSPRDQSLSVNNDWSLRLGEQSKGNSRNLESQCFPRLRLGKHWDSGEIKFTVPLVTSHH